MLKVSFVGPFCGGCNVVARDPAPARRPAWLPGAMILPPATDPATGTC
jgi:hypothetical protein